MMANYLVDLPSPIETDRLYLRPYQDGDET